MHHRVPISTCLFGVMLALSTPAQVGGSPDTVPTQKGQILGRVFDGGVPPAPLAGAVVRAWHFPRTSGAPPLPAPVSTSDARGEFVYTTMEFSGEGSFLLEITKPGFSDALRRVDVRAGGMWRVDDAYLQPLAPAVPVSATSGGTVSDPAHPEVRLVIPPNALFRDSAGVTVTLLRSTRYLPDQPPRGIAESSFVHIGGIPDGQTRSPVTLEVPNVYNLPVLTQVPFGRLDSDTVEWQDFTQASPPGTVGVVRRRLDNSTYLEVQLSRFSALGPGMCLLIKPLQGGVPDPDGGGGDGGCGDGPSCDKCNSVISYREGHLGETLSLPAFTEFGAPWALSLGYTSYSAAPSATLTVTTSQGDRTPAVATQARFQVEGTVAEAFFSSSSEGQRVIANWFWDGRNGAGVQLPSGVYPFSIQAAKLNTGLPLSARQNFTLEPGGNVGSGSYPGLTVMRTDRITGRTVIINQRNSPYGAGWCMVQQPRLHLHTDGRILLTQGNADWRVFARDPGNAYRWIPPVGEFSTLTYLPSTGIYIRSRRNGSRQEFDVSGRVQREVDRYGNTVTYQYVADLLTQVTSPTGFFVRFTYDSAGKLFRADDSAQRTTRFAVDFAGDLVQVTDPLGGVRRFQYDSEHRLMAQFGSRGERTEYHYRNGRVVAALAIDTDGQTLLRERRFTPSALNGEIGEGLRLGQGTLSNPIPAVIYVPSIRTGSGRVLGQGRIDQIVDGRGVTSLRETNERNQTTLAVDGLGRWRTFDFSIERLLNAWARPDGAMVSHTYDSFGNLVTRSEEPTPGGRPLYTSSFQYDTQRFDVLTLAVDAEGKQTRYVPDSLGNVTAIIDHDGKQWTMEYRDPRFWRLRTRATMPTGDTTTFTYDAHGNQASVTDYPDPVNSPGGRTTRYGRDAAGNIIIVTDALQYSTRWTYDAWNQVRSRTDALQHTVTYDYSDQGCGCQSPNLTRVSFPTTPNPTSIVFQYDGLNRLKTRTDQLGNETHYSYDREGNLTTVVNRNGESITYDYDPVGQMTRKTLGPPFPGVTTYGYNPNGDLILGINDDVRLELEYDSLSRLVSAKTTLAIPVGGGSNVPFAHTLAYTYDKVGNRKSMTDAWAGYSVSYLYDNRHRLSALHVPSLGGQTWTLAYDDSGKRRSVTAAPAGVRSTYSWDQAGQLQSVAYASTPSLAIYYTQYDSRGDLVTQQTYVGTSILGANYSYDLTRQLQAVSMTDTFGDRKTSGVYSYDAANRMLTDGETDFAYDTEGRQVRRRRRMSQVIDQFKYDADGTLRGFEQLAPVGGILTTVQSVRYTYDPLGRRVSKNVNGVVHNYLHDGDSLLHIADGLMRIDRSFVHGIGIDEPLAVMDRVVGDTHYYLADRLGSLVGVASADGGLKQSVVYGEFGGTMSRITATAGFPWAFVGREREIDVDMYSYRARMYGAEQGRFAREDPIDIEGGLNLFAYVGNNPVNRIDPFGLAAIWIGVEKPNPLYCPGEWVCSDAPSIPLPGFNGQIQGAGCTCYWTCKGYSTPRYPLPAPHVTLEPSCPCTAAPGPDSTGTRFK